VGSAALGYSEKSRIPFFLDQIGRMKRRGKGLEKLRVAFPLEVPPDEKAFQLGSETRWGLHQGTRGPRDGRGLPKVLVRNATDSLPGISGDDECGTPDLLILVGEISSYLDNLLGGVRS
jgi:hypothetical protein